MSSGSNEKYNPAALWEMYDSAFLKAWPILGAKSQDISAFSALILTILFKNVSPQLQQIFSCHESGNQIPKES